MVTRRSFEFVLETVQGGFICWQTVPRPQLDTSWSCKTVDTGPVCRTVCLFTSQLTPLVPNYTARWQRQVCVNDFAEVALDSAAVGIEAVASPTPWPLCHRAAPTHLMSLCVRAVRCSSSLCCWPTLSTLHLRSNCSRKTEAADTAAPHRDWFGRRSSPWKFATWRMARFTTGAWTSFGNAPRVMTRPQK